MAQLIFKEIYNRILLSTKTRTQAELAHVLQIRQSSISDAKRRNSIPSDWYLKLFEQFSLNPDWIKQGTGPMYLQKHPQYEFEKYAHSEISEPPPAPYEVNNQTNSNLKTVYSMDYAPNTKDTFLKELNPIAKITLPLPYGSPDIIVFYTEADLFLPIVYKNAYIGIDPDSTNPMPGHLYALTMPPGNIVLKKIALHPDKNTLYLLQTDQPSTKSSITIQDYNACVIGHLSWVLQKF